jgi:tetratricopeptide (TPR) repeat protein
MYHGTETPRIARRQVEAIPGRDPVEAARIALDRVRKTLTAFRPGVPLDPAALRAVLSEMQLPQEFEVERLFALGWLSWLDGAYNAAEPLLSQAVELARQQEAKEQLAEASYWLARVRLRLDRMDAIAGFEATLRQLGGSPQATAWFVDLLWRAGRVDRAEQVWKSVRNNKRVLACPEGRLLEARSLLWRGDTGGAIKALVECHPTNSVVWVERLLLLAWAEVALGRRDKALEFLRRIEELPYPPAAFETWRRAVEQSDVAGFVPVVLRDLECGYRAILAGCTPDATESFRAAVALPAAAPFARYALARLGHDNFADILAARPGLFLAVRCRVRLALERFRLRETSAADWLDTLHREGRLGYVPSSAIDHFRELALILREPPDAAGLLQLVQDQERAEPAARRNVLRAAVEVARRRPVSEVPLGVPVAAWMLHKAARAVGREDFVEALACVQRAQEADPDAIDAAVRDALPELERRSAAQLLGGADITDSPNQAQTQWSPPPAAWFLVDLVDLLREQPDGTAILAAASRGDHDCLAALPTRPDLPPRLVHHLALIELRLAQSREEDDGAAAEPHWRRSWIAWLRFSPELQDPQRALLLDWSLAIHRRRIGDLLARNAVDAARRHWALVQTLPGLAVQQSEPLGRDLTARVERFRDELASDYLIATRESMRYGDVPEGWRADYEKGLTHLRRMLSLDHDNLRLLTALVEICGDWFLDLYNAADRGRLAEQVGRFSPFAQQLVRLTESQAGDLAARAALSEYFKFRGFVASDEAEQVAHYREALPFNPGNENARELLQRLGAGLGDPP